MATSGTYVTEVPLNGTAEKYYKRWKSENHLFPDSVGHHIQSVPVHDGDWDSHGGFKIWNYMLGLHIRTSPHELIRSHVNISKTTTMYVCGERKLNKTESSAILTRQSNLGKIKL
ncbi:unnamed protein product [Brassica oleracea]